MVIFSDLVNVFQLQDYTLSHSQLLIRSSFNQYRDYNIDILFKPVSTMLVPKRFEGIEISLLESEEKQKILVEEYHFSLLYGSKIFSLKCSNDKTYFINALAFGVFQNKLMPNTSSIGRYDWGTLGEMVLWYK